MSDPLMRPNVSHPRHPTQTVPPAVMPWLGTDRRAVRLLTFFDSRPAGKSADRVLQRISSVGLTASTVISFPEQTVFLQLRPAACEIDDRARKALLFYLPND